MNMFVLPPLICIKWFCRFTFSIFSNVLVFLYDRHYTITLLDSSLRLISLISSIFFLIILCHRPDVPFVGGQVDVVKKVPKTADDPKACSPNGLEFKALHFTTGVCLATLVSSADEPRCSHGLRFKKKCQLEVLLCMELNHFTPVKRAWGTRMCSPMCSMVMAWATKRRRRYLLAICVCVRASPRRR